MSKVFFKYNKLLQGYSIFEGAQTCNFILQDFFSFLRAWGSKDISWLHQYGEMNWESLHLSKIDGQNKVILWNSDYTKQMIDVPFDQLAKYKAICSEYH